MRFDDSGRETEFQFPRFFLDTLANRNSETIHMFTLLTASRLVQVQGSHTLFKKKKKKAITCHYQDLPIIIIKIIG